MSAPSSAALSGAPLDLGVTPSSPGAEAGSIPAREGGAPQPAASSGIASWHDDGPGLYAAVPGWHFGDQPYRLVVSAGSSSVVVEVRDACGCPRGRLIDLSPAAFARLAPLSAGLVRVTITRSPTVTPPPTDR